MIIEDTEYILNYYKIDHKWAGTKKQILVFIKNDGGVYEYNTTVKVRYYYSLLHIIYAAYIPDFKEIRITS